MTGTNGSARVGTSTVKQGLAQMLKGGVIVSGISLDSYCTTGCVVREFGCHPGTMCPPVHLKLYMFSPNNYLYWYMFLFVFMFV